jgi:NitT/TauT family transport system substrate-binding protein
MKARGSWQRREILHLGAIALGSLGGLFSEPRSATGAESGTLETVHFATDWLAQAEHGGFYQAMATGIYRRYGLEVIIRMGGPGSPSGTELLMSGAANFSMGFSIDALNAVVQNIPKVTVAAFFQKEPQCLLAHPEASVQTIADLRGHPLYLPPGAQTTFWPLLKARFGFTDDQLRLYDFDLKPFLNDLTAVQQGYVTSEAFEVKQAGGFEPVIFLLADFGYSPYGNTIETTLPLVEQQPDLVRRFVEASIEGWYCYLDDPRPGNHLIQAANPAMTCEQLAYGVAKLKEHNILTDGVQKIGSMTSSRWRSLYKELVSVGVLPNNVNYSKAYTLKFVSNDS